MSLQKGRSSRTTIGTDRLLCNQLLTFVCTSGIFVHCKEENVPRPRQSASSPSLSSGQASYVIDRMISDRRVSPGEIIRYVNEMQREIDELEKRLQALRAAAGGGSAMPSAAPARRRGRPPGSRNRAKAAAPAPAAAAGGAKGGRRRRRRSAITAEQLASRQLQGRYLGLIRQIPASRRGQYQRTAKEKGREAAIKDMQSALGK